MIIQDFSIFKNWMTTKYGESTIEFSSESARPVTEMVTGVIPYSPVEITQMWGVLGQENRRDEGDDRLKIPKYELNLSEIETSYNEYLSTLS